jgi:hypothetical protein
MRSKGCHPVGFNGKIPYMKQLDEIIYDAICADKALMTAIGGHDRVVSTCFEVSPTEKDNTPVPNIIVSDDGFQNNNSTKDTVWEGSDDIVQVTVDIAAESPDKVKILVKMARRAIEKYIVTLYTQNYRAPEFDSLSSDGIQWDWTKPCYYQKLTYQCITKAYIDDEQ